MLNDVGMTVPESRETRAVQIKCKKHFTEMLKDVGMVVPKMKGTRYIIT